MSAHIHAVAIKRLYESQRRTVLNTRPENIQRAQLNDIKKKYRVRQERVRHLYAKLVLYIVIIPFNSSRQGASLFLTN